MNGETFSIMSGTTARLKVCETDGYFNTQPTPEDIRENFVAIMDDRTTTESDLNFPTDELSRGAEGVDRYLSAVADRLP